MKCKICKENIVLVPSATERAKKYGGKASDYTKLFTTHTQCVIDKRNNDVLKIIQTNNEQVKRMGG